MLDELIPGCHDSGYRSRNYPDPHSLGGVIVSLKNAAVKVCGKTGMERGKVFQLVE